MAGDSVYFAIVCGRHSILLAIVIRRLMSAFRIARMIAHTPPVIKRDWKVLPYHLQ